MKRKLGIVANCLSGIKEIDALPLIKAAGFETFFTTRAYKRDEVREIKRVADELSLEEEFLATCYERIKKISEM